MSKKNLESFLLMISHDKKQNSHNKVIVILFSFFKKKIQIFYRLSKFHPNYDISY